MVVGEAEPVDVPFLRDSKGEVSPTEGVLEAHLAFVASASDRDTLRDQQALWGRETRRGMRTNALHPFHLPFDHQTQATDLQTSP